MSIPLLELNGDIIAFILHTMPIDMSVSIPLMLFEDDIISKILGIMETVDIITFSFCSKFTKQFVKTTIPFVSRGLYTHIKQDVGGLQMDIATRSEDLTMQLGHNVLSPDNGVELSIKLKDTTGILVKIRKPKYSYKDYIDHLMEITRLKSISTFRIANNEITIESLSKCVSSWQLFCLGIINTDIFQDLRDVPRLFTNTLNILLQGTLIPKACIEHTLLSNFDYVYLTQDVNTDTILASCARQISIKNSLLSQKDLKGGVR